ncbi:hypothetical protein Ava_0217 [Trichormus variabilis ATCC 29413]|uniref:Uncharacterized protein n=1 Tax=Trichormus variabilis (strain ATCC 29413 / PCC 7937) TaxID=240292 RepID=Q3MGP3_TRIV2|nr:hypothetical protein Ava_0217 [Trichormus variabilis ATCC 29413]
MGEEDAIYRVFTDGLFVPFFFLIGITLRASARQTLCSIREPAHASVLLCVINHFLAQWRSHTMLFNLIISLSLRHRTQPV